MAGKSSPALSAPATRLAPAGQIGPFFYAYGRLGELRAPRHL
ncbi:hypothetical protein [Streptomyces sp. Ag109_O5-1]|nr:hypothetical protein [Streptomyces sp. Ag109_O5-1]